MSLLGRMEPAPVDGGLHLDDYYVWGSTVVRGKDGKHHMWATVWPRTTAKSFAISPEGSYYGHTTICKAVSDTPEGPYHFEGQVLQPRPGMFDGISCHNPAVIRYEDQYVLYYCGYDGQKHVGCALADSPYGPWRRAEASIFPGRTIDANNPAPCVCPDGSILLIFRADRMDLHAAKAPGPDGPYDIVAGPLLDEMAEDPFVWRQEGGYRMIVEDNAGRYTGARVNGALFRSNDGVSWTAAEPTRAYGHPIVLTDGREIHGRQEKPSLLLDDAGRPTHLFLVKAQEVGDDPYHDIWNVCVPLGR